MSTQGEFGSMDCSPLVHPRELEEWIASGADIRLLDVRTPGEFETAHIAGACNVPLDLLPERAEEIAKPIERQLVLVCQSGMRARKADETLRALGFRHLHILDGGMNGWLAAGRPANIGRRRISLERQVRIVAGSLSAAGAALALLVSPWFALVPLFVGSGLVFAGVTGICGMAMLLAKLPWNATATCDAR